MIDSFPSNDDCRPTRKRLRSRRKRAREREGLRFRVGMVPSRFWLRNQQGVACVLLESVICGLRTERRNGEIFILSPDKGTLESRSGIQRGDTVILVDFNSLLFDRRFTCSEDRILSLSSSLPLSQIIGRPSLGRHLVSLRSTAIRGWSHR